jgi:hypothetical protein
MSIGDFVARFGLSVTMLSAIILLSIFFVLRVLRSKTLSRAETWSEDERTRISWLKIGTTIAVVLCWTGAFVSAANSPLWNGGTINWSMFDGYTYILDVGLWGILVIGLPMLATAFWLKILRHNWPDGEAPSASMYLANYSLWLALIWSKLVIGW